MAKLSDVQNKGLLDLLAGVSLTKPILAINAPGAATVRTTAAFSYTVNGVLLTRAALSAQSMAVTHDAFGNPSTGFVQPANQTVFYTLGLNAAGVLSVAQSTFFGQVVQPNALVGVGANFNAGTSVSGSGQIVDSPAGATPVGVIKVVTGPVTFTAGTTVLDVANVTATYFDVMVLPSGLL